MNIHKLLVSCKKASILTLFLFSLTIFSQEKKLELEGVVTDETTYTIPYAAITLVAKNSGTSSTEEGTFSIIITKNDLLDTIHVSSMGFKPFKMGVQDFLNQKDKKIVLIENVTSIDEVTILPPYEYVKKAKKELRKNMGSKKHQLNLLYRRAISESDKTKFFIEHYMKVLDLGPGAYISTLQVAEARKSADYRIWRPEIKHHSIHYMESRNPFRVSDSRPNFKDYTWKNIGDSSYEGEDVIIIEGKTKSGPDRGYIKLFIGMETYSVYKIERPSTLFLYKKNKDGKLYLSYFTRKWTAGQHLVPGHIKKTPAKTTSYRTEAFVYEVITDKKKFNVRAYGDTEMTNLKLPYNSEFWKNFSLPPATEIYKKAKEQIESIYNVPLEKQYELVNK